MIETFNRLAKGPLPEHVKHLVSVCDVVVLNDVVVTALVVEAVIKGIA